MKEYIAYIHRKAKNFEMEYTFVSLLAAIVMAGFLTVILIIADCRHNVNELEGLHAYQAKFKYIIKLDIGNHGEYNYTDAYSISNNSITFTNADNQLVTSDSKWIITQQH